MPVELALVYDAARGWRYEDALSARDPATAREVGMYYLSATVAATEVIRAAVEAWGP